jgi:probable phosphoglycerate mutase
MPRDFQAPFTLPVGATEIVCVRHGSSLATAGLVDGRNDPPLSDRGLAQAEAVATRLGDEPAAALYVTPLQRTAQTVAPLAQRLGLDPVVVEELREVHLGDWEGQFTTRMKERDPVSRDVLAAGRWDVIPNAEDMDGFSARVLGGLERIAADVGPGATAVAVLHGGVIAEACRQATRSLPFAFLYAENGSITRLLRLPSGRWALRSFNDVAHLSVAPEPAR